MNSIIQNYCSDGWNEYIEFHSKIVQVKKGDFIFETGQAIEGLHIIHAGKVKITTKEVKQMMEDEGLEEEDALAEILNGYMAEMGQLFTQTIILSESEVEYIKLKLK